MVNKLDISSLIKAYESFSNALKTASILESDYSEIFYSKEFARAAVIHNFGYTYELAWKMMKRYIEMEDRNIKILSRKDLFRIAGEKELIHDFHKWVDFHEARNKTSHTYDEDTAEEVYIIAKEFEEYVKDFISTLKERIEYDERLDESMGNH